ncbi:hypothetical protein [Clostridium ganghwense]|uniref:hypothetical protein n=1 Tax=Clostridium ganghwense TaxID=312089 RepID=UPI00227D3611|nr:hypothetical protein [Clostridium ganghwense]
MSSSKITNKKEYAHTTGTLGDVTKTYAYEYTDANWKDLLKKFNGSEIVYDAIGNQNKFAKIFILLFIVLAMLLFVIAIVNNKFPQVWEQYKSIFIVLTLAVFIYFTIYIIILAIKNIGKIK